MPKPRRYAISGSSRRSAAGAAALLLGLLMAVWGCGEGSGEKGEIQTPPPGRVALDAESQEVAEKIQANMQDFIITNKVPSTAKVTLEWVKKAPYTGMFEANFVIEVGGVQGRRSFFFDAEAKHFVMGPVYTVGEVFRARVETRNMVLLDRPAKGPEAAPIVIAEYSDFQCPFCGAASRTVNAIMKKYDGKVRLVFKHMPLSELHAWAYDAAITSECAAAQKPEAFWYFHDYFFDPSKRLDEDNFKDKTESFAKTLDLDIGKLNACVESQEPKARIDYDLNEAINYGFTSTPTFVINGVVVIGNQPLPVLEEIIQEELKKAGQLAG
ncbi:MAG: thioredoxin domain-containing protein [Deltaproteobacteria bacterium]|nr:thioredoxin domain-containing protein [Deltaproteobacteria bacterium]